MKSPLLGGLVLVAISATAAAVDFRKDVLPILESNCIKCHKDGKEKGDLNLQEHKIKEFIGSGLPIVPGKPSGGLLMKVVMSDDPDYKMPPKGSRLSEKEIATLKMWIAEGAELAAEVGGQEPLEGEWTNKAGKKIKAALLRVEDEKAVLKLTNGKIYKYPIVNLDAASQKRVKEFAENGRK